MIQYDVVHQGNEISRQASEQFREAAGLVSVGMYDDLSRKQRSAIKGISETTSTDFLDIAEGIFGDPRQVLALNFIAKMGDKIVGTGPVGERLRKLGSPILSAGLSDYHSPIELGLLRPNALKAISRAGANGYVTHQVKGVYLGVQYSHPLRGLPSHITEDPYLATAAKYWSLGGGASSSYDKTHYLMNVPESQRISFEAAADEIRKIRDNNYWGRYKNFHSNNRSSSEGYGSQSGTDNNTYTKPDVPKPNDFALNDIIELVVDTKCRNTLNTINPLSVRCVLEFIRDMRAINEGITDRQVYLTCRQNLETGDTIGELNLSPHEVVTIIDLLLSGNVSKTAKFPQY